MPTTVTRQDPRFPIMRHGNNLRFPTHEEDYAGRIAYCDSPEDAAIALQKVLDAGLRPTVRSSGHCYEDFVVNNPNGAILDVSLLNRVSTGPGGAAPYRIQPGAMLGVIYQELYKRSNVTIPGGTCFTVTAGGHVSGGGYGLLARLHGLSTDWVSAVDILTVNAAGKVTPIQADATHNTDLFRALRGGGGGSFGLITGFTFNQLPPAPSQVIETGMSFDAATMTPEKYAKILATFGDYWQQHDQVKETWGLFGMMYFHGKGSNAAISINTQFTNPDGTVTDLTVLKDFLARFDAFQPTTRQPDLRPRLWIEATVNGGGGPLSIGGGGRAKYKSAYMKKSFTEAEALAFYNALQQESSRGIIIAVDCYGGAVNNPARARDTAIPQRTSLMKLQYQTYWNDPADDAARLKGIRDVYTAAYSTDLVDPAHKGTPYPGDHYDGCYMNYPDADMLDHPFWTDLYYGTGDTHPFLRKVKNTYDPHNVFHHAMSIRP
ncbi:FAD-binding protein [Granulicella tundricola]|uniref:Berberine/berberine domain protein n=1 Tax=Granulicella tundricola (strain ATCC BAA-1859 / DSM 23138 / MP5ACTX9) TaxID=1198114 RepID=E8X6Y2_GRATM|nr:BBE domain-containing protein [Granulicella tundricola]ADW71091.1 Berberine/berberine domain protein [Granulicella tundricola MP5ACTX9]